MNGLELRKGYVLRVRYRDGDWQLELTDVQTAEQITLTSPEALRSHLERLVRETPPTTRVRRP
ncbi:MAG: hypothetical protein HC933_03595 [Pleurocapsa sp. SU_196_0]|nr:hypothetical protein [Pleurocapsa sp. SU_196_0]